MDWMLYRLTFDDGKHYIGRTRDLARRRMDHKKPSGRRGPGVPAVTILAIGERDYIRDLEGKAILAFQTNDPNFGYNTAIGRNLSPETKEKIRQKRLGQKHSAEAKAKMKGRKPWNKGVERTPEERAAIKAALDKSGKASGAREKLIALNKSRTGRSFAPEHLANLRGKPKPKSPETREKMRLAALRRHQRERSIPHN